MIYNDLDPRYPIIHFSRLDGLPLGCRSLRAKMSQGSLGNKCVETPSALLIQGTHGRSGRVWLAGLRTRFH